MASQGVWAIAGFAPTTQGKDERSHQTLTRFLDARQPLSLADVQSALVEYRDFYNNRRRHQGLLVDKMHITPAQAWDNFPHADRPTEPIDPDQMWAKIAKGYHLAYGSDTHAGDVVDRADKALSEVAASDRAHGHDNASTQQDQHHAAPSTVAHVTHEVNPVWAIPHELWINKSGVVRILGHGLYVGSRFKNRKLYSNVTDDNHAEFFTDHDGEKLFSFPLPITLLERPPGGQININHVEGMWHRRPPALKPNLSNPRPSRRKTPH
nr:integrase core domain-containing protein [Corynebacterium phocae]